MKIVWTALLGAMLAGPALADSAPDPWELDDRIAGLIRDKGVACSRLADRTALRDAEGERLRAQGYRDVSLARCREGAVAVYATARRRPGSGVQPPGPYFRLVRPNRR